MTFPATRSSLSAAAGWLEVPEYSEMLLQGHGGGVPPTAVRPRRAMQRVDQTRHESPCHQRW